MRRVVVERYEDEGPDRIMVYGTDKSSAEKVCFRVSGERVKHMRESIESGEQVEVELPDRGRMN